MRDIDPARPLRALPASPPDPVAVAPSRPGAAPLEESPLRDVIAALRRRALIIVIAIVALPAGALAYSLNSEDQYTATAKLLFRDPGFDQKLLGGPVLAPSVDPAREAATNIGLVSLDTVSGRAAESSKIRTRALTSRADPRQGDGRRAGPVERRRGERRRRRPAVRGDASRTRSRASTSSFAATPTARRSTRRCASCSAS